MTWFVRGTMVLTGLGGPDGRHPHWDMPLSWGCTCGLVAYALLYIWGQRMPPAVRERFDRRQRFNRERVQDLVATGRTADAKLAAEGADIQAQFHELGLSSATQQALRAAPDPYAP